VALTALVIAWRLRRAQRRDEAVHGYGPPIVVFPKPSDTAIKPAERRRPPNPAAQTFPAAASTNHADIQPVPNPGGEQAAAPPTRPGSRDWQAPGAGDGYGFGRGDGAGFGASDAADVAGAGAPTDGRPLDAAARLREVERRLRDDMELPLRVEQDQPAEVQERPIRRRSVHRDMPDSMDTQGRGMDGALALAPSQAAPAANVRPMPPVGGTLQMLPGRLVIVEGEEAGRELRFVRLGSNPQSVTVGRNAGRPYEHVQLRAQTVSRLHARLQYDEGRWSVENLSRTNPLVVNGRAVAAGAAPQVLAEGDVVEVGEVLLRFHER